MLGRSDSGVVEWFHEYSFGEGGVVETALVKPGVLPFDISRWESPQPHRQLPAGLVTGVLAELALALPFGALSALLLDTGMRSTRRVALSAATGVALADIAFATAAALAGATVTAALEPWARDMHLVSAVLVLVLGMYALRCARLPSREAPGARAEGTATHDRTQSRRAMLRFAALSAANPLTTITLTTMAAGLGANVGLAAAAWFVVGCGVVSMGWHGILAAGGQVVGATLGGSARSVASHLGAGVTILMAVLMVLSA